VAVQSTPARYILRAALEQLAIGRGPGVFGLVAEQGEVIFAECVGTADLENGRPILAHDRFRVASLTKVYTATLVLQLVDEGRLGLGDTLEQWLPGLVDNPAGITVEHLLTMRSGLPDYIFALLGDPPHDLEALSRYYSPPELVGIALSQPGRRPPGRAHRYSNTNYLLLGLILEQAGELPLEALMWERIFYPLGLMDTSFPTVDPYVRGQHVRGYMRLSPDDDYVDCTEYTPSEAWAAGALISTPLEVVRFLEGLFEGELLPEHLVAAMRTPIPIEDRPGRGYGYGLVCLELPDGEALFGHGGDHFGVSCLALRSEHGRTMVVYQNCLDAVTKGIGRDNPFIQAAFGPLEL